jgi:hypothetical protein
MTVQFQVTNTVAQALATALETSIDAGTAAVIRILTGSLPTLASDTETGTLLGTLTGSATFGAVTGSGTNGRITAGAIASDTSADNTGTASYFRLLTQTGGTIIAQGNIGVGAGFDLQLNTTAITAGSTIAITSATIDVPQGP